MIRNVKGDIRKHELTPLQNSGRVEGNGCDFWDQQSSVVSFLQCVCKEAKVRVQRPLQTNGWVLKSTKDQAAGSDTATKCIPGRETSVDVCTREFCNQCFLCRLDS